METYSKFGHVESCRIAREHSGMSKCFGFVSFRHRESAEMALEACEKGELVMAAADGKWWHLKSSWAKRTDVRRRQPVARKSAPESSDDSQQETAPGCTWPSSRSESSEDATLRVPHLQLVSIAGPMVCCELDLEAECPPTRIAQLAALANGPCLPLLRPEAADRMLKFLDVQHSGTTSTGDLEAFLRRAQPACYED